MPAVGLVEQFKATIDGSFNIYHSGSGNEGYGNNGTGSFPRLMKGHQHLGFMDWDGAEGVGSGTPLNDFVNLNGVQTVFLYIHASQGALSGKGGIITIRTGNVGNIVEDNGFNGAYNSDFTGSGVAGSSGPEAFRMADYEIVGPPLRYANHGAGIDKYGAGTFAGQAWRRPVYSGLPAGTRSGTPTFKPGDYCYTGTLGVNARGFWDTELYGVEGVVGFHWSQASNTAQRFRDAGQMVNQDIDGNFLWFDPANQILSSDANGIWYKVPINPTIVRDIVVNPENKGIVFSNWVAGAVNNYANNSFDSSEHQGGAWAPYLEIITPEPMTLTLLAMGGLALIRRRR
jgi:hypothetical protein